MHNIEFSLNWHFIFTGDQCFWLWRLLTSVDTNLFLWTTWNYIARTDSFSSNSLRFTVSWLISDNVNSKSVGILTIITVETTILIIILPIVVTIIIAILTSDSITISCPFKVCTDRVTETIFWQMTNTTAVITLTILIVSIIRTSKRILLFDWCDWLERFDRKLLLEAFELKLSLLLRCGCLQSCDWWPDLWQLKHNLFFLLLSTTNSLSLTSPFCDEQSGEMTGFITCIINLAVIMITIVIILITIVIIRITTIWMQRIDLSVIDIRSISSKIQIWHFGIFCTSNVSDIPFAMILSTTFGFSFLIKR